MIQYTMLTGPTSTIESAHHLGKLLEGKSIIVNLIPYNQTDVDDEYSCPSKEHIEEFQRVVMSYGLFVFVRRTMGEDIAGACGQLVLEKRKKDGEEKKGEEGDIEDVGRGPVGKVEVKVKVKTKRKAVEKEDVRPKAVGKWRPDDDGVDIGLYVAAGVAMASAVALVAVLFLDRRRKVR